MASRNNHRIPLTRSELTFWKTAFLANVLKRGNRRVAPAGAAHLSADYARAAVIELRNVKSEGI